MNYPKTINFIDNHVTCECNEKRGLYTYMYLDFFKADSFKR